MSNQSIPTFTDISTLGEFGLINELTKNNTSNHQNTIKSIGDDAAVIGTNDESIVISTDMLVEGIHFDHHVHAA